MSALESLRRIKPISSSIRRKLKVRSSSLTQGISQRSLRRDETPLRRREKLPRQRRDLRRSLPLVIHRRRTPHRDHLASSRNHIAESSSASSAGFGPSAESPKSDDATPSRSIVSASMKSTLYPADRIADISSGEISCAISPRHRHLARRKAQPTHHRSAAAPQPDWPARPAAAANSPAAMYFVTAGITGCHGL